MDDEIMTDGSICDNAFAIMDELDLVSSMYPNCVSIGTWRKEIQYLLHEGMLHDGPSVSNSIEECLPQILQTFSSSFLSTEAKMTFPMRSCKLGAIVLYVIPFN